MAQSRIQVNPDAGIPDPTLKPSAQVGDTYIRPNSEDSSGAQLAQALSGLAPDLARFGNTIFQRQSAADIETGAQKARDTVRNLDQSRTSYADAVKGGLVPAHLNPWMKQGYYEELGRTYAGRLKADMTSAVDQDQNLQSSVEMGDFRKFTSDFESSWLDQNVPAEIRNSAFNVGYGNRRDAVVGEMEGAWSSQTEQRFTHRTLQMFRDDSENFISDALDKGQSPADIGTYLRQSWDDKHSLGWDARLTGTSLVDAISDIAVSRKDPTLMKTLLDAVPVGKDGSRLSSSYSVAKTDETTTKIFDATREDWATTDRARQEASRSIDAEGSQRVLDMQKNGTDPSTLDFTDLRTKAIANGDSALDGKLQAMQVAAKSKDYQDNPEVLADLRAKFYTSANAVTQPMLTAALNAHQLTVQSFTAMSEALRTHQHENLVWGREAVTFGQGQADRKSPGYLDKDGDYQNGQAQLKSLFGNGLVADTPALDEARESALRDLKTQYYDRFLAPGAPDANMAPSSRQRSTAISEMVHDLGIKYAPVGDKGFTGITINQRPTDSWQKEAADIPTRVGPILDELESGKLPSPSAVSLLKAYSVPLTSKGIKDFIAAQRKFLPATPKGTP